MAAIDLRPHDVSTAGMTLVELVIVMGIIGILLATAVPAYRHYMRRVHRTEAIRLLLQASMCQERIHASKGNYDSGQCQPVSGDDHYRIAYSQSDNHHYQVMATPLGAQADDPCGSLWMDQSGARGNSVEGINSMNCWSGR